MQIPQATTKAALFVLCVSSSMSVLANPPSRDEKSTSIEQQLQESREAVMAARAEAKRLTSEAEKSPRPAAAVMDSPAIKAAQSEWTEALLAKIEPNWLRPSSEERRDYPCKATVRLLPDGTVVYVAFRSPCSASGLVEQSIEAAIYRSSPLPVPTDPAAFVSTLAIAFSPDAQR